MKGYMDNVLKSMTEGLREELADERRKMKNGLKEIREKATRCEEDFFCDQLFKRLALEFLADLGQGSGCDPQRRYRLKPVLRTARRWENLIEVGIGPDGLGVGGR